MDNITIQHGLEPTPRDRRDYSHHAVFGSITPASIPLVDFMVEQPIKIKNQHASDMCTGFAATAVSEDQEAVELSPEFQFALIKMIRGEYTQYGGDLRSGCKSMCDYGSLEQKDAPFTLDTKTRDFLANWNNWPLATLKPLAAAHKKSSFFKVDGPGDMFDNIRAALWQHRDQKQSVYTGLMWRHSWLYAPGGVIPEAYTQEASITGHCIKLGGQKIINGVPYLTNINSAGPGVGDGGLFYFPRSVINKELKAYGAYQFNDLAPETAKVLNTKSITLTPWQRMWRAFLAQMPCPVHQ